MDEIAHLKTALTTSREIGAAIGIIMERHSLAYDGAWQMLRQASQNSYITVRAVAAHLVLTSELDTSPGNSEGEHRPLEF